MGGATRHTAIELIKCDQTQKAECDLIWVENRGQPNATLDTRGVHRRSNLFFDPEFCRAASGRRTWHYFIGCKRRSERRRYVGVRYNGDPERVDHGASSSPLAPATTLAKSNARSATCARWVMIGNSKFAARKTDADLCGWRSGTRRSRAPPDLQADEERDRHGRASV